MGSFLLLPQVISWVLHEPQTQGTLIQGVTLLILRPNSREDFCSLILEYISFPYPDLNPIVPTYFSSEPVDTTLFTNGGAWLSRSQERVTLDLEVVSSSHRLCVAITKEK